MSIDDLNKLFDKFLSENKGKKIERVDPNAYAQCFDLAIYWCEYMGFPKTIFSGLYGAHEIYDNWSNASFEKIRNTATFVPKKGDIVVWSGALNGGIGHVAVATGDGDINRFRSFDQNWVVGSPATIVDHDYRYVLGVQRLKVTSSPSQPMDDKNVKKAVQFDRIVSFYNEKGVLSSSDSNQYLENDALVGAVKNVYADLDSNRGRAGKWDQLCIKAGLTGDSNKVTVDQLYNALKTPAQPPVDTAKIKEEGRVAGVKQVKDAVALTLANQK